MTERVLTLAKAAERYGVSPSHLRDEWKAARLTVHDIGTGKRPMLRVDVDEMERWWAAQPVAIPGKRRSA